MIDSLILAVLLDICFGELPNRFHPVAIMGKMFLFLENFFYKMKNRFLGGILHFMVSQLTVLAIIFFLSSIFEKKDFFYFIFKTFVFYSFLSIKGMKDHAIKIFNLLFYDEEEARKKLRYIVSRDVENMDRRKIIKSTIESIGENFNDAFFAPFFYAALFGIYGITFYKVTNTLDAMVGYKNKKYIKFGTFSAKVDDILNYFPARLQIIPFLFISLLLFKRGEEVLHTFLLYKNSLKSPNAGCGIAIFAGALNITLGGDTYYFNKLVKKPEIVGGKKQITPFKILEAIELYYSGAIFTSLLYIAVKISFL